MVSRRPVVWSTIRIYPRASAPSRCYQVRQLGRHAEQRRKSIELTSSNAPLVARAGIPFTKYWKSSAVTGRLSVDDLTWRSVNHKADGVGILASSADIRPNRTQTSHIALAGRRRAPSEPELSRRSRQRLIISDGRAAESRRRVGHGQRS